MNLKFCTYMHIQDQARRFLPNKNWIIYVFIGAQCYVFTYIPTNLPWQTELIVVILLPKYKEYSIFWKDKPKSPNWKVSSKKLNMCLHWRTMLWFHVYVYQFTLTNRIQCCDETNVFSQKKAKSIQHIDIFSVCCKGVEGVSW